MESSIIILDERTDQATRKVLQKVVERKQRYEQLKSRHLIVMWSTIFISFFYFIYLYYYLFQPYSYSFSAIFSGYVNQSSNLYMLILLLVYMDL